MSGEEGAKAVMKHWTQLMEKIKEPESMKVKKPHRINENQLRVLRYFPLTSVPSLSSQFSFSAS